MKFGGSYIRSVLVEQLGHDRVKISFKWAKQILNLSIVMIIYLVTQTENTYLFVVLRTVHIYKLFDESKIKAIYIVTFNRIIYI